MHSQRHFMLDLETLGTGPDAFILQIGVCPFDPFANKPLQEAVGEPSRWSISLDQPNGQIDAATVAWWTQQSEEARAAVFASAAGVPMARALMQFDCFVEGANDPVIWAKPPSFDCVILESAYRRTGLKTPWRYNATRCVRTICDLAGMTKDDLTEPVVLHDAGYDAKAQAFDVCRAMRILAGERASGVFRGRVTTREG